MIIPALDRAYWGIMARKVSWPAASNEPTDNNNDCENEPIVSIDVKMTQ